MMRRHDNALVLVLMMFVLSNLVNCTVGHGCNNGFHAKKNSSLGGLALGLVRRGGGIAQAIERSKERLHMFLKDPESPIHAGNGEFLMLIGIGSPALNYNAIVDTGSDLIWTQCKPCSDCYKQRGQIFDPSKSKTYSTVPCSSSLCRALPSASCGPDCQYMYEYGDYSYTMGDLAYETFTLATTTRGNVAIPRVAFGCGHDNQGGGFAQGSGLVGLGRGRLSLISQMGSTANNKFSYCLVSVNDPASKTSPLLFGDSADLRGSGIKSTPIVTNEAQPTFYYLDLQGVSVDGSRLSIPHGTFDIKADGSGGVIIDSGTTITYLEQDGYDSVKTAVQASMKLREADGSRIGLDLCYKLPFDSSAVKVPAITFHFAGADFYLPGQNAFYRDEESQLFCLAMAASNGLSIFGNIQQQNYHILYDLGINRLSFIHTACDAL
ncbi:aspartic proteinase nepenthesin-2 [Cryptomeria japonica]|uniref:aspartic proteinase nepenthesin-2 n=1 Tax=Cryptomeria japonica TaxID=3369 RepID=UPI0027DA617E|nr:aspartic proteinase nepenthesin-2 [Cryptomeria japonica]